jgi:xanthine dehydrogenase accessory factor
MSTIDTSILVCGIGEIASAIARRLFAEGYAVAIHQETPPRTLWRGMAFADAWFNGSAELDGFEARCVEKKTEFLYGLQGRSFIPMLRRPFADVVEMWSWDAVVAAADSGLKPLAEYAATSFLCANPAEASPRSDRAPAAHKADT